MLLDKTAIVSILVSNNPSTDKETYTTFSGFMYGGVQASAVPINIQPASPELTAISEGETFKTFKAFTTASGVVEGMIVTISGTNDVYRVRGREVYDYGAGQHYELTLAKGDIA